MIRQLGKVAIFTRSKRVNQIVFDPEVMSSGRNSAVKDIIAIDGQDAPFMVIAQSIVDMNDTLIESTLPGSIRACQDMHLLLAQTQLLHSNAAKVASIAAENLKPPDDECKR